MTQLGPLGLPGSLGPLGLLGTALLLASRGRPSVGGIARARLARPVPARAPRGRATAPVPHPRPWLPVAGGVATLVAGLLFFGVPGALVAAASATVVALGVRGLGTAATSATATAADRARIPLVLELIAAALSAGAPTNAAVALAVPAAPAALREALRRCAGLLDLGADPLEAWATLRSHPTLEPVAIIAARSAESGSRLAEGLRRYADELRVQLRMDAVRRAHRIGAIGLLPLGLCFLPGFVLLGIVPIVVGIAGDAFAQVGP